VGSLAPILISSLAIVVSGLSLFRASRLDQRDQFLKMHERLIDADLQIGRRILRDRISSVQDAQRLRSDAPEDHQLVTRALAMLDILALYVEQEYVDADLVLREWGHTYAGCWERAQFYIAARLAADDGQWSAWPNLQKFGARAAAWADANPHGTLRPELSISGKTRSEVAPESTATYPASQERLQQDDLRPRTP
jgi:hypothetical protein